MVYNLKMGKEFEVESIIDGFLNACYSDVIMVFGYPCYNK
jgi:hypothetical protein